jgi:hypothetical protein
MTAHWEWLRKLIQANHSPTHISYLTDRLVFLAGALPELMRLIAREPDRVISYHHDRVEDADATAELVQTQWTGEILELDARKLIEMSSRCSWGDHLPRMLNCIVPVSLLDAIEERFGSVFAPVSPDYRFTYRCLATVDTILYLDRACVLEHGMARSAGVSYMRGRPNRDAANFVSDLPVERFGATPEPGFETVANAMTAEYCSVRAETGGDHFPPLDMASYLAANAESIRRIEDPEWRGRMRVTLERHGWTQWASRRATSSRALAMAGYYAAHPSAIVRSVRRQLVERPPGTPLATLLPRIGVNPRVRDELRFGSSAEAIAHAEANPRPRMPYAWHVHRLRRAGAIVRALPPPDGS